MPDTQVIVAGGGPVGLAAAVELGRRGIRVLVVEPRRTVSHARPRCKTVSVRSMEHLRRWGIADELRSRAPLSTDWTQDVVFCTSLVGRELSRFTGVLGLAAEGDRFPELGQQAPQYVLEELLRDVVCGLASCTLVTGRSVTDVAQTDDEVRVTVRDEAGLETTVTAEYLIGADGPRSTVRERIGAVYDGEHALRPNFGMVFTAPDLWARVRHGAAVHYWIVNGQAPALMGPIDRDGTWWMIAFGVGRETGERDARQLIAAAVGAEVDATVLSTDPWTARMQIVDRMWLGRVFLAGDAAHLNPPFGGHGLNTGLGDAVDLGWKLAAVLDGWGGPALLDSYEKERRPIQERVIREATANMAVTSTELLADNLDADDEAGRRARAAADDRIQATKRAEFHSLELVLDIRIEDSPVVAGGDAAVGGRLAHLWLGGRSLFDELGPGFTLLVLTEAAAGRADLVARAAEDRGVPLRRLDLSGRDLRSRYGADLVLVRPDQYVAWSGDHPPAPADLIDRVRGAADGPAAHAG
ncbi:monooxygenase [Catellatospora sp. TT07R-123]|uniref:FAD-dependent monooxygenase n=1 Tax=Catellatospora sp. TT07R-123 TaxID=2733863 RepID=UPI001B21267B|nr:FAD-dependent monooxygenase [Catellatospora sp. TT07R-123]GHJ47093.1 monooxygenase [Catellatospora sp. TT07R-123]